MNFYDDCSVKVNREVKSVGRQKLKSESREKLLDTFWCNHILCTQKDIRFLFSDVFSSFFGTEKETKHKIMKKYDFLDFNSGLNQQKIKSWKFNATSMNACSLFTFHSLRGDYFHIVVFFVQIFATFSCFSLCLLLRKNNLRLWNFTTCVMSHTISSEQANEMYVIRTSEKPARWFNMLT